MSTSNEQSVSLKPARSVLLAVANCLIRGTLQSPNPVPRQYTGQFSQGDKWLTEIFLAVVREDMRPLDKESVYFYRRTRDFLTLTTQIWNIKASALNPSDDMVWAGHAILMFWFVCNNRASFGDNPMFAETWKQLDEMAREHGPIVLKLGANDGLLLERDFYET